jgi:hypothetical protein
MVKRSSKLYEQDVGSIPAEYVNGNKYKSSYMSKEDIQSVKLAL